MGICPIAALPGLGVVVGKQLFCLDLFSLTWQEATHVAWLGRYIDMSQGFRRGVWRKIGLRVISLQMVIKVMEMDGIA